MDQITDYGPIVDNLRIEFYNGSNLISGIAKGDNPQYEELEQVNFDLIEKRWLDTAEGVQLDVLGEILDIERFGRDDESYRTLLQLKVKINVGSGTPELLIESVKLLYNATTVNYIPAYPAGVTIEQDGTSALFILNNLIAIGGNNFVTTSGDNLVIRQPDTVAADLVDTVVPAGVKVTIVQI